MSRRLGARSLLAVMALSAASLSVLPEAASASPSPVLVYTVGTTKIVRATAADPTDRTQVARFARGVRQVVLSPRGDQVAAIATVSDDVGDDVQEIVVMNRNGGRQSVRAQATVDDGLTFSGLTWTKSGGRLYYGLVDASDNTGDLYSVSTSGTPHPAPLTGGSGLFNPSMSPSGHELAAVKGTTEHGSSLVVFQPSSGAVTSTLAHTRVFFGSPAWSPDGKRIAVEKESSEVSAIRVVPAKGGPAVTAAHGENPVWRTPRMIWFDSSSPAGPGDLKSTALSKASKKWHKPVNRTRTPHLDEADPSFGPIAR
jgi:hypothetical protein